MEHSYYSFLELALQQLKYVYFMEIMLMNLPFCYVKKRQDDTMKLCKLSELCFGVYGKEKRNRMEKWIRVNYQPNLPLGEDGRKVTESREHILLSKNAAKEGMVLLKNEQQVLPLAAGSKVALFGKGTFDYVKGGGGSGDVTVSYVHNLYDGLSMLKDKVSVFEETAEFYREQVQKQYAQGKVPGMTQEPKLPKAMLERAAAYTDTAIISISRFSGEGWDRKVAGDQKRKKKSEDDHMVEESEKLFERGDFYLTRAEEAMVKQVKTAFAKVIVVMNVGGMVDTQWFRDDAGISAVLMAWQGGMEGGLAAAELLMGEGNPSGKLSDTFAKSLEDYPSTAGFHESDQYVDYTEDIYVGYRYFETIPGAAEKVNYPFGYGLSYTRFEVTGVQVNERKGVLEASATVCNVGEYAGKEVVQVYFSAPQGKLGKPAKALIGYKKTGLLQPGAQQQVRISFRAEDMASYDDLGKIRKSAYVLEKGSYAFHIGTSVRDTQKSEYTLELKKDKVVKTLKPELVPTSLEKRMLADGSFEMLPQGKANDPDENILRREKLQNMDLCAPAVRARAPFVFFGVKSEKHQLIEVAQGKLTLDQFITQLSDEDLAALLGGQPNTGVANTFGYGNLPEYGVPNVMTADGPAGLRIWPQCGVHTTAFPCATLLACTWDPEVTQMVGKAGGAEVKENNIAVWLTPAVNIHRSPLCGRNFEYYSEDPFLTGKQAAGMVRGIQSNHVGATVKHFALNDKETNRRGSDSRASERAIREIYLKAFEIIVKEADPWSIMSSYNIINGHRASEDHDLLTDVLRGEWGYEGMVTTDWWNLAEHYKEVKAGNDVKMGLGFPERLLEAKKKGAVSRKEMETCGKRILKLILKVD